MRIKEFRALARRWKYELKRLFTITKFPNVSNTANLGLNDIVVNPENLIMGEHTNLKRNDVIMNGRAKFIIKHNSGAAEELMVITGNHMSVIGKFVTEVTNEVKDREDIHHEYDEDVIIEEDVWIGARVSILSGVKVGRGCEIGTGTVLRTSTPPYSIVIGNPAKVVGFRFTPEEIVEHEKILYPEEERLPYELLKRNYERYFIKRIKEIKNFIKL